ncbi:MAG: hypothetical protein KFKLKKLM_02458 [Flavobacteriales bacterium]|nr:hypothetical protein [Flavobacteriales bacterium]
MIEEDIVFKVKAKPIFWKKKAEELKFVADSLWSGIEQRQQLIIDNLDNKKFDFSSLNPDTFSICLSLMGYSIEVLLKGIIIKNNPQFVSNGTMATHLKKHDLIYLSNQAEITLSDNEKIFFEQAHQAILIDSRYPIPSKKEELSSSMTIGGNCIEVHKELFNRLTQILME